MWPLICNSSGEIQSPSVTNSATSRPPASRWCGCSLRAVYRRPGLVIWRSPSDVELCLIALSDLYRFEYAGHVTKWDEFVVRGSLADRKLIGFYLVGGVVRAVVGLDRGGDPELDLDGEMAAAASLVAGQARPASAVLADEHTDPTAR